MPRTPPPHSVTEVQSDADFWAKFTRDLIAVGKENGVFSGGGIMTYALVNGSLKGLPGDGE